MKDFITGLILTVLAITLVSLLGSTDAVEQKPLSSNFNMVNAVENISAPDDVVNDIGENTCIIRLEAERTIEINEATGKVNIILRVANFNEVFGNQFADVEIQPIKISIRAEE